MNAIINYTIQEIAKSTGGKLLNFNADLPAPDNLSLDSRKIINTDNTIFFAIKSSLHNGNIFVEELYKKGVRNFVVSDNKIDIRLFPLANIILVTNTINALQRLATHHRSRFVSIPIIGITGSNGKTVVKEWLNQLLESDYSIVRSPGSYNSQVGVPLSVLNIDVRHTLGIFEAGISRKGEMKNLEKIIKPSIGIFTNIGQAHDEGFDNISQKINEKLQLFKQAKQLVFCGDNYQLKKAIIDFKKQSNKKLQLFSWGKNSDNKLKILSVKEIKGSTKIEADFSGKKFSITIPFTDKASIDNAINCWCILLLLNKNAEKFRQKFSSLYPIAMRLELKQGINNCSIINDSYSNDLHSLEIAIGFLEHQKQHKTKTIILSDILQSGKPAKKLYDEIAQLIKHRKINRFVGIGPDIFSRQQAFSFIKDKVFFLTLEEFLRSFPRLHFHNETILIKGARRFNFEQIVKRLELKMHQTKLNINLNAIVHNYKQYKSLLKSSTKIMAMVKAFSYGSGVYEIASILEYHKAEYLAVAYTDEGVGLRSAGITLPIMVMNAETATFEALIENNLEPEIFSFNILQAFFNFLEFSGINNYPVHIKIETGMHRLGFTIEEIDELCDKLESNNLIIVKSVFTHLVAAESEKEDAFTIKQYDIFKKCCTKFERSLGYKFIKHIANTSAISRHPKLQMDMVRLGIGLYGIDRNEKMQRRLKNVTTLITTVSQIKRVYAGETVGYGRNARLEKDSVIATVRIGYADGYPRKLGNGIGKMLVQGELAPVIGNVCMDMTMIDVTNIEPVREGDEVTVFGERLPLSILAIWAQTIPYEIMTGISQRVSRVYFEE
jgi:alanine racemase